MPRRMHRKNFLEPIPEGGKLIARPTKFGNDFKEHIDGTLAEIISKYEAWLMTEPGLIVKVKKELRGKDLYCACKPGQPCHGDVLLRIANED